MAVTVLRHRVFVQGPRTRRQTLFCRVLFFSALLSLVLRKSGFSSKQLSPRGSKPSLSPSSHQDSPVLFRSFTQQNGYGSSQSLYLLLESITIRQRPTQTPFVVILVVNYAYRNLAINFVCNLIRIGVTDYLVFALDRSVFDLFVIQNINVFLYVEDGSLLHEKIATNTQEKEDVFGTPNFVETSRRKSILVLETLKLGFSVIFSDVDVVWVRNPIPKLLGEPEDIVIQSDRPTSDINSPPNSCINSGMYFARSNPKTVNAFHAIVKYARAIKRSEQKAFNYVLCGAFKGHHAGPGSRLGTTRCVYVPKGTTVSTLDAKSFPNGSDKRLWHSVRSFSEAYPRVIAIHANYVFGRSEKVKRIQRIGFWFYPEQAPGKGCVYPSHLGNRMLSS